MNKEKGIYELISAVEKYNAENIEKTYLTFVRMML